MKDTLAFCIAICMMIGQVKGSFAIPSLQTTGALQSGHYECG